MNQVHHKSPLRGVDLNLLVILDALLQERHVTRAARRLGLTQSAVSHGLGRLRKQFNDPLLVRTAQGMKPTPNALALQNRLGSFLNDAAELLGNPRVFKPATAHVTVAIGAADYAAFLVVPKLMAKLSTVAPNVRIWIKPSIDPSEDLLSGQIDLSLHPPRVDDLGRSLRNETMFSDDFVCVVRNGPSSTERAL